MDLGCLSFPSCFSLCLFRSLFFIHFFLSLSLSLSLASSFVMRSVLDVRNLIGDLRVACAESVCEYVRFGTVEV